MLSKVYYLISFITLFETVVMQQSKTKDVPSQWNANFTTPNQTVYMDTNFFLPFTIWTEEVDSVNYIFKLKSQNQKIAYVDYIVNSTGTSKKYLTANATVSARLIGSTIIYVEGTNMITNITDLSKGTINIVVVRKKRIIDHVFTGSIILLCSLLYINFGAALDLNILRTLIRHPVGPAIGIILQSLIMPLLSYGLGYIIFFDNPEMHLGMFFTGVSPSGEASNIWTVFLGGNIHLSVLLTTISNLAAFVTIPIWLFTLGPTLFKQSDLSDPFLRIAETVFGLIIPLAIGICVQKCSPRLTTKLVTSLKPIASFLLLFIIVFAILTNLYLFDLFSWQIILAGFCLPWLGYIFGWTAAKICKQSQMDALTIAIETGIQNTGISILLLRLSLPDPQRDLATVIPVSVAIMTSLPLCGIYLYKRFGFPTPKDGVREYRTEERLS